MSVIIQTRLMAKSVREVIGAMFLVLFALTLLAKKLNEL